jgi:hypothetical protein
MSSAQLDITQLRNLHNLTIESLLIFCFNEGLNSPSLQGNFGLFVCSDVIFLESNRIVNKI